MGNDRYYCYINLTHCGTFLSLIQESTILLYLSICLDCDEYMCVCVSRFQMWDSRLREKCFQQNYAFLVGFVHYSRDLQVLY